MPISLAEHLPDFEADFSEDSAYEGFDVRCMGTGASPLWDGHREMRHSSGPKKHFIGFDRATRVCHSGLEAEAW